LEKELVDQEVQLGNLALVDLVVLLEPLVVMVELMVQVVEVKKMTLPVLVVMAHKVL